MSVPTKLMVLSLGVLCLTAQPTFCQQAAWSDSFVDSVGINVHLGYDNTLYSDFPLVRSSLSSLGVRHLRDGLVDTKSASYYVKHNLLGALGIKTIFTTSVGQAPSLWQNYPSRVASVFEGYEGPNEYDLSGDLHWEVTLENSSQLLSSTVRNAGSHFPVLAPSLTQLPSYQLFGNHASSYDNGNLHNYFSNRNPGTTGWGDLDTHGNAYGSISYALDEASTTSSPLPTMTTETGYTNDNASPGHISEAIAAVYMPRLLLEQWNAGIKRTYLYELMSEGNEDFGLLRTDGTYKPAFYSVSYLLNLLSDKGPAFTPGSFAHTLVGADASIHQLLLQKQDGTFFLALWRELSSYDPNQYTAVTVLPLAVQLQSDRYMSAVTTFQWDDTGNVTPNAVSSGRSIPLSISDRLTIVKLQAAPVASGVNVRLSSNVPGGWMSIDGAPIPVGSILNWNPGDVHVVNRYSPQAKDGIVYLFQEWTAGLSGTTDGSITTPHSDITLAGRYVAANALNAYGLGGGGVVLANQGSSWGGLPYFVPTDTTTVAAIPNAGCRFVRWFGDASSTDTSITLTMSTYKNVIAVFTCGAQ